MSDQTPPSQPDSPASIPVLGTPSKEECNMAMLMYILGILTGWIAPLIIWLLKKDTSPFINDQGKELLNFQITVFIALIVCGLLTFVVIGCFLTRRSSSATSSSASWERWRWARASPTDSRSPSGCSSNQRGKASRERGIKGSRAPMPRPLDALMP